MAIIPKTWEDILFAFQYLIDRGERVYPYGIYPQGILNDATVSKEWWMTIRWNPPQNSHYTEPDPEARPKPSWEEIVQLYRSALLARWSSSHGGGSSINRVQHVARASYSISHAPVDHEHSDEPVRVGGGLDHMPAMVALASLVQIAGASWNPLVMLDTGHDPVRFWVGSEGHELLEAHAQNRILAESVKSILHSRLKPFFDIVNDEKGGLPETATEDQRLDAREAARTEIEKLVGTRVLADAAVAKIKQEVEALANTLPKDRNRANKVLASRLSITANRQRNIVIDAAEAADSYLPAGCVEQERALSEISAIRQRALLEIRAAATVEDAKLVHRRAELTLGRVTVLNTPVWSASDGSALVYDEFNTIPVIIASGGPRDIVSFQFRNPRERDLQLGRRRVEDLGPPMFTGMTGEAGWSTRVTGPTAGVYTVTLRWTPTLAPAEETTVILFARNRCGPSLVGVRVKRPTEMPS